MYTDRIFDAAHQIVEFETSLAQVMTFVSGYILCEIYMLLLAMSGGLLYCPW